MHSRLFWWKVIAWTYSEVKYWAMDFEARQSEYRAWKLLERRKVPSYNAQLGGVIVEFHRHLSKDEHYLVTNCSICRKYLSEIKSYSKKLEQAMK